MGIFDPKWKSSNPLTRRDAILKIADQSVLKELATIDPVGFVRMAAAEKLNDITLAQKVYEEIAKKLHENEKLRITAINKLTDIRVIAAIKEQECRIGVVTDKKYGFNTSTNNVFKEAIKKHNIETEKKQKEIESISDQIQLFDLAVQFEEEGLFFTALNRITDQEILKKLYDEVTNGNSRLAIGKRFTDQSYAGTKYKDLLRNEKNPHTRSEAAGLIDDQNFLSEFIKTESDLNIRMIIADKLVNTEMAQEIYFQIVKSESTYYGEIAVSKLTDQRMLEDVARTSKVKTIIGKAIEKLDDQNILYNLIKTGNEQEYSTLIIAKLTNQDYLIDLAKTNKDNHIRRNAAMKVTDQQALNDIVLSLEDSYAKGLLAEKLVDRNTLEKLYKKSGGFENKYLRETIIKNPAFSDQDLLSGIAMTDKEADVRKAAISKLDETTRLKILPYIDRTVTEKTQDKDILADIVKKAGSEYIRITALKNLVPEGQKIIAEAAIKDEEFIVRIAAVELVTDQPLLAEIAVSAPAFYDSSYWEDRDLRNERVESESEDSGYKAILKLTDRELLQKVYNEAKSDRIRDKALMKLRQ